MPWMSIRRQISRSGFKHAQGRYKRGSPAKEYGITCTCDHFLACRGSPLYPPPWWRTPLEHSGVDQFTPFLTICSTMSSRVDADVEGFNILGNSSQPSFSRTPSWSSPSCGWVAHCSYQDSVMISLWRVATFKNSLGAARHSPAWVGELGVPYCEIWNLSEGPNIFPSSA